MQRAGRQLHKYGGLSWGVGEGGHRLQVDVNRQGRCVVREAEAVLGQVERGSHPAEG